MCEMPYFRPFSDLATGINDSGLMSKIILLHEIIG